MTFRFIHTSDWHIAKPFRRFDPALAGELAAARLGAITRIAGIAREKGATHILVAGDVFDSELIAASEIRRALHRLAEEADLIWLLLPGNHDPARISGVWDQVARIGTPGNVVVLDNATPYMVGNEVAVLPAPLTSKDPGRDCTAWMDTAATPPEVARVGLAHGSVRGFGSDDVAALQIDSDRARRAGLSYLALGDWHGVARISDETWYAGTPEPDQFPENEPGNVLSVAVEDSRLVAVEKVRSGAFTWLRMERAIHAAADLPAIERDLQASAESLSKVLVRLVLKGHLSLSDSIALKSWRTDWGARLRLLEVDDMALALSPETTDFEALGLDGSLLQAARELAAIGEDASDAKKDLAATALLRLCGFVAEVQNEAGQ